MMLGACASSGDTERHDMPLISAVYKQRWLNRTPVKEGRGLTVPQAQDAIIRACEDGATAAAC